MPISVKTLLLSLVLLAAWAGSTSSQPQLVGDMNGDHVVDSKDLQTLVWQWLSPGCITPGCIADLDGVNGVNMADLALLANNWQKVDPHIIISEFMARNSSTILDGNNESSDWIEIHNPTDTTVNLDGWYLTDKKNNLTKWQFPNGLEVKPGEFLLIFASEKTFEEYPHNYPYLDSAGYYHTNFELDQDGEYLALVTADGNNVAHEYAQTFPVQLADISYGLAQDARLLVSTGATASYHVPTSGDAGLGTDWTDVDFDDSGWDAGPTSIGIGDPDSGMGTILREYWTDIPGQSVSELTGNSNYPDNPSGSSEPTLFEAPVDWAHYYGTRMHGFLYPPVSGDYTFWISSDDASELWLSTDDNPANKALIAFETTWSQSREWQTGAEQSASIALTGGQKYYIEALHKEGDGKDNLAVTWNLNYGQPIEGQYLSPWTGSWVATNVREDMLGVNASLWTRIEFVLEEGDVGAFDSLTLRIKYEDGFVVYLNGQYLTKKNAPGSLPWNATSLSDRPIEDSSVFEAINLNAFLDTLQSGRNVLAIHALNNHQDNEDFLVLPELIAARNRIIPEYFTTATPETFNIPGAIGVVSDVWISTEGTFYTGPPDWHIDVTLSNGTKGAEIRYTFDGSRPTISHGLIYNPVTDPPLEIDRTTVLRAVAVKPGWLDSRVETHTYIFPDDVLHQPDNPSDFPMSWGGIGADYGMDELIVNNPLYAGTLKSDLKAIPTMSLVMDLNDLFDSETGIYANPYGEGVAWERPGSIELLNPDGSEGFRLDCGVRIYGGVGRREKKKTLRLLFKGIYGPPKLRYPLFGENAAKEFDTIILRANFNDGYVWGGADSQYIRDEYVRQLQLALGHPSAHGTFVHLYINGLYWGLYNPTERPQASFAANYFGGKKEDWDALNSGSPTGESTTDTWYDMLNLVRQGLSTNGAYQRLQGNNPDGTPNPAYVDYLDVENYIDYMIVNFFTGNRDWPGHNWYAAMNRVETSGWKSFSWDAEWVVGMRSGLYENRTGVDRSLCEPYDRLRDNAEFRLLFADHAHRAFLNGGHLYVDPDNPNWDNSHPERNRPAALYAQLADIIERAMVAETARWGDVLGGLPYTLSHWISARDWVLDTYMPDRSEIVLDQLRNADLYPDVNAPVFYINGSYRHGGPVLAGDVFSMHKNNPSGDIYYTLDGSDPRQPVSGNAVGTIYTSSVTLNKTSHVKARVREGITWSALNEAIFAVGPIVENLRITEIMYHPRYTGNLNDPNEEFIELKNIGTSTLNLNLVKFTEGIDFTFPDMELNPDEYVVVVKNQSAFEAQYGTSVNMAGQYIGSLANDGERIKLQDAIGRTILDFEYKDGWRSITDGDGFSLTMINPSDIYGLDEGLVAHWKFDEGSGGTATDSAGTNNGALVGDTTWTTGQIDGALSFDGNGDYVSLAAIAALTGDTLTAQAWIRLSDLGSKPILTQHLTNMTRDGYYFYITGGRPTFYLIDGFTSAQAISTETINADQWYHIAGTNDGSNLKLYVDGRLKSNVSSAGFTGVSTNAYIGRDISSAVHYNGLIDDVRIYNRAVSESEFLDIADPVGRWNLKKSWRASVYRNGTPGADDSGILPNPSAVVINEVMAHSNTGPDWIELHNTTNDSINIGGWYLSDDNKDEPNLMKYRIADGTTIASNDYLVFYQDTDFNNPGDPGCLIPFGLSENGEEACLSSHLDPNGYLTGYRQVENFGASQTNVSLGRYYKPSTDNFNFVAMDYNTPDSNNAYPKVGPVVINEIMYNPPTGNQDEEYIELHNITGALVTLYRYDKLTSWNIGQGPDNLYSKVWQYAVRRSGSRRL
ncbi:MAG: lamin tail domain-containing protein [Planctomycetota bacterium]